MALRWRRKQSGIVFSMQRTRVEVSQGGAVGVGPGPGRAGWSKSLIQGGTRSVTLSTHAASRALPQGALGTYTWSVDTIRREGVWGGGGEERLPLLLKKR